jgi:hypothetical protein
MLLGAYTAKIRHVHISAYSTSTYTHPTHAHVPFISGDGAPVMINLMGFQRITFQKINNIPEVTPYNVFKLLHYFSYKKLSNL